MAGWGPSTSGKVLDEGTLHFLPFGRSTFMLPQQYGVRRISVRREAFTVPNNLVKGLHQLFRAPLQEAPAEALFTEISPVSLKQEQTQRTPFGSLLRQATYAAVHVGLKLTGLAIQLAKTVVGDVRRTVRYLQIQQQVEREAAAAKEALSADTLQALEQRRESLRRQGKDAAFMQMLHTLDRSHMGLEAKWALVRQTTADKAEFSERLQQLYKAARESKEAVETMLRPNASRTEVNNFWKSPQTAALIAEEDALKQLVFAQMLQASAA